LGELEIMTNTDVVKKLIGSVEPYGSADIDRQRLENLKAMCELVGDLVEEIKEAAKAKERHEHSMKEMGLYAYNFLSQLETEVGF
jgi:fructose-1,6-bisphosphatase/sedoheptulose 1,7-bisphosphatase-like protein